MSDSAARADASASPRIERLQPWMAALLSALLHALLLLLFLAAENPVVTAPPQGASSSGRVRVDFIGESPQAEEPVQAPPSPAPTPAPRPPETEVARDRAPPLRPVRQADYVLPPDEPQPAPQPPDPQPPTPQQSQAPASSPASTVRRRTETWNGRPPGMLEEDLAHDDGRAAGPADRDGQRMDLDGTQTSMEVGGYQIVYDLLAEERLRTWQAEGMKEISFPLPGLRSRMVCPVEIAIRRESGKCRLLEPTDPEMQGIGDARQVVVVLYVYRRGELVWRGPGPYR